MQNPMQTTTEAPIIKRLRVLFDELMNDADVIPKQFKPVARNLVEGYLRKADPKQVEEIIRRIEREIIPWILHDSQPKTFVQSLRDSIETSQPASPDHDTNKKI